MSVDRAWKEIDLNALSHNLRQLRAILPRRTDIMAVLKADAYGHGATLIAEQLQKQNLRYFAVATLDEAIELRRSGIEGEILVLGYTPAERVDELAAFSVSQTVVDERHAEVLNSRKVAIAAHLKIDTGMHRIGIDWQDGAAIFRALSLPYLCYQGIFSHLATADCPEPPAKDFAKAQIDAFETALNYVKSSGGQRIKRHLLSSYGVLNYPEGAYDYVRTGLGLYGLIDQNKVFSATAIPLLPVLSLHSRITMIKNIPTGESVGYDRRFVAGRDSRIAVISIGYADGLPRSLSCGKGRVLVRGRYAPTVGWVCMDQACIDVTDIPEAAYGDTVTLIGRQNKNTLTAVQMAHMSGTIVNDLVSRLGHRLSVKIADRQTKTPSVSKGVCWSQRAESNR